MIFPVRLTLFDTLVLLLSCMSYGADTWTYRDGDVTIEIDTRDSGSISNWQVGGRNLVAAEVGGVMLRDGSGGLWTFHADHAVAASGGDGVRVIGQLAPEGETASPAVAMQLTYQITEQGKRIALTITSDAAPDVELLSYGWSLPLALNPRKRVYYQSDYGLAWDTRYFYQLFLEPRSSADAPGWSLLPEPDRNIWRFFALDQSGPDAYRLWKSSDEGMAAITMHEGRAPVPAVQVYDEQGGVSIEYPRLREAAPKSLRVDAAEGARAEVLFWPPTEAPVSAKKTDAFVPHEIILTAYGSEQAVLEAQSDLTARYGESFTPQPDVDVLLEEEAWVTAAPLEAVQAITGGWPFAEGELRDVAGVRVSVAGDSVALQAKPLAYWPDGSIKWVQLTFAIDASRAVDDCPAPRVSLRSGQFVPVAITVDESATRPDVAQPLSLIEEEGGIVRVENNGLAAEFGPGKDWWRWVEWQGMRVIDGSSAERLAYADYVIDPEAVFPFDYQAEGGLSDAGVLNVDLVTVEESGPLRAVIRLEGVTDNEEPTRIVMRLEFVAGRPEIKITHTAVFRFKDPRRTFLTGLGLDLPIAEELLEGASTDVVQLFQPTIRERRLLVDGEQVAGADAPSGWLRVGNDRVGVTAAIRNFRQQAPKAITADYGGKSLKLELWPDDHAPMDARRYSGFLHHAQLEAGHPPPISKWVEEYYYPNEPFYGVSRTHELTLVFDSGNAQSVERGEAVAADFQSPPLLYAGWEHYDQTGTTALPSASAESWPRAWQAWTTLTRFFLWHRQLHGWEGFWTFGDFQHRFQGGYGWIVPPEVLRQMPEENLMPVRVMDNRPANDWSYDTGAYGWTNTEGLPNLFLQHEYLRHGNRVVFFAAEALARYSRDVVVRQEGMWLGRGTRHGVQPWSCGNHEERQTASTEYRLHYLLSGDGRTRDVIENLYENVYLKGAVGRHASHSGRLPGLLFHWELTGDPKEGERLQNYVSQFVSPKGIYVSPQVRFPSASKNGEPRELNDGGQFFHTFGGMHTLIEYHALTGDPELAAGLIAMADAIITRPIINNGRLGQGDYSWAPVAFAALHADNPEPYKDFLTRYIQIGGWRDAYQPVSLNPEHWSGETGFMTKTVALSFFWANWAPYVARALSNGEIWSPRIENEFQKFEQQGRPGRGPRPSWQSEFDGIPEIDVYLGAQQPWRNSK